MEEIGRQSGAGRTPLPCDYFDLIGGTSTGGLIAIMLGRLRMVCPKQE
jgi:patatin-like phospholipase/acyl hydrolase